MFVYEYASGALNYANKEKDSELPPPTQEPRHKSYNPKIFKNVRHYSTSSSLNNIKTKKESNNVLSLIDEDIQFKTWLINNKPEKNIF